jgi:hypothetical protein
MESIYADVAFLNETLQEFGQAIRFGPFSAPDSKHFEHNLVSASPFLSASKLAMFQRVARQTTPPTRVHIPIHKRGATISYHELHSCAPELIAFYQSQELRDWCSSVAGCRVVPTPLNDLSSCSLLIYDKPHDHIRPHYDHNFYRGRHFTGLLSLVNTNADGTDVSSAKLIVRYPSSYRVVPTAPNTFVLFEGAYVHHGVTALREGECRIILSMTFCTEPSATPFQTIQRRIKDIAYFGLPALWR